MTATTSRKYKKPEPPRDMFGNVISTSPRITSCIGWRLTDKHKEAPVGESQTIPDQSYTIADLVKKMARGVDPAISKVPNFGGDDEELDFDDVDVRQAAEADLADSDEILKAAAIRQLQLLHEMEERKKQGIADKKGNDKKADLRNDTEAKKEEPKKQEIPVKGESLDKQKNPTD